MITEDLETTLLYNEIRDIAEFLDLPIFWLLKILPSAIKNIFINYGFQDVKTDLTAHLSNPGCLTKGGHSCDGFINESIYKDFQSMCAKYRKGEYIDFETQAQQIIKRADAYHIFITPIETNLVKLREQMEYLAGFDAKLFILNCTDKRNYLNEKNKPKCELCITPTNEFGYFCIEYPEMRQNYQRIITEIVRISEENKTQPRQEYIELLRAINQVRLWYVKPEQCGSSRWIY